MFYHLLSVMPTVLFHMWHMTYRARFLSLSLSAYPYVCESIAAATAAVVNKHVFLCEYVCICRYELNYLYMCIHTLSIYTATLWRTHQFQTVCFAVAIVVVAFLCTSSWFWYCALCAFHCPSFYVVQKVKSHTVHHNTKRLQFEQMHCCCCCFWLLFWARSFSYSPSHPLRPNRSRSRYLISNLKTTINNRMEKLKYQIFKWN